MSALMTEAFVTVESLGPLIWEDPFHTTCLRLHQAWGVQVDEDKYIVPAHFVSDGGSVPRLLWRLCGHPWSKARPGFLLHDAGYHRRLLHRTPTGVYIPGKPEVDKLLRVVARWNGHSGFESSVVYKGVDWFGKHSWSRYDGAVLSPEELLVKFDYTVRPA